MISLKKIIFFLAGLFLFTGNSSNLANDLEDIKSQNIKLKKEIEALKYIKYQKKGE